MADVLDKATQIREGEELDLATLETYLKDSIEGLNGALEVQQFPSGFSNLTYLLKVGDRELILRRPPFGSKVKSAHDMGREYQVLSALNPVYPAAPKPLAFCQDEAVLGADFYVMERIKGVIVRGQKPEGFATDAGTIQGACESMIDNLAQLHSLDYSAVGLDAMKREGSYVERQVTGWIKRYAGSQTDAVESMDAVGQWLVGHYPADVDSVLVHNDYKFDNVVLDPEDLTKIIGVLDWEMCTIGDPLMDLGTSLGYWMEPDDTDIGVVSCFFTHEPGYIDRNAVVERYAAQSGRDVSNVLFYYVFGLYKLSVIVQQIYYRYKQGLTKDKRFAALIFVVGALGMRAQEAIEAGKI